MKLLCAVLVTYVLTLALWGVDGRGGGTTNGFEKSMGNYVRARRHAIGGAALEATHYGNEQPPPPPLRSRRNAANLSFDTEHQSPPDAMHLRQRRQMPAPPPPPEGMPPPPEGMPPPPSYT
ncbi:hypothetical protein KR093_004161 [Drosophila rubida]|uniref:Uncharacterized protein n=1 Tax=Drosophila rubida TaxID=30044 RepID=A0AAD4JR12_9MUSC|nr:hypothetical protein KR093_004161 [Drosophila rubida]